MNEEAKQLLRLMGIPVVEVRSFPGLIFSSPLLETRITDAFMYV